MSNVKTTCLRFNLDKPIYCKAWEILQSSDKSHSKLIAEALAEYHDRHSKLADDPYFENREREDKFVEQIVSAVGTSLEKALPSFLTACLVNITQPYNITTTAVKASEAEPQTETSADEIDWDFLGG